MLDRCAYSLAIFTITKQMENKFLTKEEKVSSSAKFFAQHSKRMQIGICALFFLSCLLFLFVLEAKLAEQQSRLEFAYKEFYLRPFHYKLDPFSYVELKNGVPITEPEPPNPKYTFSYDELLLNRFIDYFFWLNGMTDEGDATTDPDRIGLTMQALGSHIRNRIYYQLEHNDLRINPILLTDPAIPEDPKPEDFEEPNKLLWNVIPYCNDPVLEESLHELGNIHGFLYARANHMNYRFVDEGDTKNLTALVAAIPIKMAYLHHHNFLNFTRQGLKSPVQISIICEPIDRKLRHFYTERWNYKEWAEDFPISKTKWWRQSLEECLAIEGSQECGYKGVANIKKRSVLDVGRTWLPRRTEWIIPQFCEYHRCNELGDERDLSYVKHVVENEYTVVGTLEDMDETLDLLEAKVPQFFKGIKELYNKKLAIAKLAKKPPCPEIPGISPQIQMEMVKRYAPETEFYKFVSKRLRKEASHIKKKLNLI